MRGILDYANEGGVFNPLAPPQGIAQLAMFIGPGSTAFDWQAAAAFLNAERGGKKADGNWRENGTFREPDTGSIWQEISDDKMTMKTGKGKLADIVNHPELFAAHPELRDHTITVNVPGMFDSADPHGWNKGTDTYVSGASENDRLNTLVHELNHKTRNASIGPNAKPVKGYDVRRPESFDTMNDYKEYLARPDEIMSRLAERRRTMTPQERKDVFPLFMLDLVRGQIGEAPAPFYRDPRTWRGPIR